MAVAEEMTFGNKKFMATAKKSAKVIKTIVPIEEKIVVENNEAASEHKKTPSLEKEMTFV